MKIIEKITVTELQDMAEKMFGDLVKADVDIRKKIVIVDMPMHFDGEQHLLEMGSKQADLWGINLYPGAYGADNFVEFDSMINLKPSQGNTSRDIKDPAVRAAILEIIAGVVHE